MPVDMQKVTTPVFDSYGMESVTVTNPALRRRDAVSGGALILMVGKHDELAMRDHAEKTELANVAGCKTD